MLKLIIVFLVIIAAELAALIVVNLRKHVPGDRPSEVGVHLPSPTPTSETAGPDFKGWTEEMRIEYARMIAELSADRRGDASEEKRAFEYDKRHQDGINSIMGYDQTVARRAVRHDADQDE